MDRKKFLWLVLILVICFLGADMTNANENPDKVKIYDTEKDTVEEVDRVVKTDKEWKAILTPQEYKITRLKGTERPFTKCDFPTKQGIYKCVACGTDLFTTAEKFDSKTGWPSFWEPVSELNIKTKPDKSLWQERTEVLCARCDAHIGHVFDDGPPPTYKRYCINGTALKFYKSE